MRKPKKDPPSLNGHSDFQSLTEVGDLVQKLAASAAKAQDAIKSGASWASAQSAWSDFSKKLQLLIPMSDQIQQINAELEKRSGREFLEFEADLREACAAEGWKIDGHWPKLFVERGISVEIVEKSRSATVGGLSIDNASSSVIVSILKPLVQELIPRGFSATTFIEKVAAAYDKAKGRSAQVPILEVYRELVLLSQKSRFWRDARKEAFVGLNLDQFRARLSRALEEAAESYPARSGRQIRLLPPLDPTDSIFLYQPFENRFGFVGRIEFVPEATVNRQGVA